MTVATCSSLNGNSWAEPRPPDILDRYWQALESGALDEAAQLRRQLEDQFAALNASMDLLDELLSARTLMQNADAELPKEPPNGGGD